MNDAWSIFLMFFSIFVICFSIFWPIESDRAGWVKAVVTICGFCIGIFGVVYSLTNISVDGNKKVEDYRIACHDLGGVVEDFNDGDWYQCIKRGYKLIDVPGYEEWQSL